MGFSISLNRKVAKNSQNFSNNKSLASLIRGYESFFIYCFIVLVLVGMLCGSFIQAVFLDTDIYSSAYLYGCVVIIFFNSAIRLPINTFLSVFMGLEKHIFANFYVFLFSFLRIGVSLLIAVNFSSVILFFLTQSIVSVLEFVFFRLSTNSQINYLKIGKRFSLKHFLPELKTSIKIGFITILSAIIVQFDKILFSSFLNLDEFGKYSVISMIALGIVSLGYPISATFFPRMSKYSYDKNLVYKNFQTGVSLLVLILLPVAALIYVYADLILNLYLGSPGLGLNFSNYLSILSVFAFFLGFGPLAGSYFYSCNLEEKLKKYNLIFVCIYIPSLTFFVSQTSMLLSIVVLTILNASFVIFLIYKSLQEMKQRILVNFMKMFIFPIFLLSISTFFIKQLSLNQNIIDLIIFYFFNLTVLLLYFSKNIYTLLRS